MATNSFYNLELEEDIIDAISLIEGNRQPHPNVDSALKKR